MSAVARSEKDAAERVLLKIKTAVEDDFMSLDHPDERDRERKEEGGARRDAARRKRAVERAVLCRDGGIIFILFLPKDPNIP